MGLIWYIILASLVVHGGAETVVNEDVLVNWANGTPTIQDKHPSLPDNVKLTLTIDNETAELNLKKNQRDNFEDIPVIFGGDKNVTVWHHKKDEELSVYNDKSKDASFSVVMKTENGKTIAEYYGSFVHKETKYSLTPINYHEMSNRTSDIVHTFTLNGTTYAVFIDKVDKSQKPVHDDVTDSDMNTNYNRPELVTPGVMIDVIVDQLSVTTPKPSEVSLNPEKESVNSGNNSTRSRRSPRRRRNTLLNIHADLMVVIDYSMYTRWLQINNNDKTRTIERMRYYLAHVINGVNNVYATMASPKLFVTVVEIFIAGTAEQSWYFEDPTIKSYLDRRRANFEKALAAFRKWVLNFKTGKGEVPTREKFLPDHDIAVVFTDYSESPTEGLAYLGTVCGDHAQGLIHEKGQYDTITTAAHEIAHVLGSRHDGDGNNCNPNDHYLMSPIMTNAKIENRDTLSSCSMQQIVNKAADLEWRNLNCMDSSKKQRKRVNLDKLLDSRPGARFSIDEQCKLRFGGDYKFCSEGEDTYTTICNQMRCFNPNDNKCYGGYPKALDGTNCGNGKWCIKGQCVYGGRANPAGKDTCPFGDKSDAFIFNEVLTTCKDLKRQPASCYSASLKKWCCDTCEEIKKNTGLERCPYGDRGMQIRMDFRIYGCEIVFQRYDACDNPNINENCCESCHKVKKGHTVPNTPEVPRRPVVPDRNQPEECKDKTNLVSETGERFDCKSLLQNPAGCYDLDKHCCETCNNVKASKNIDLKSCSYGDIGMKITMEGRIYGCSLVFQRHDACNQANINTNCCESCHKVRQAYNVPLVNRGNTYNRRG